MEFKHKLFNLRTKNKLSQNKLAKLAGLTSSAISQYESGFREPSYNALIKLSKALNVTPNDFFDLKDQTGLIENEMGLLEQKPFDNSNDKVIDNQDISNEQKYAYLVNLTRLYSHDFSKFSYTLRHNLEKLPVNQEFKQYMLYCLNFCSAIDNITGSIEYNQNIFDENKSFEDITSMLFDYAKNIDLPILITNAFKRYKIKHLNEFVWFIIFTNLINNARNAIKMRQNKLKDNRIRFHYNESEDTFYIFNTGSVINHPDLIFNEGYSETNSTGKGLSLIKDLLSIINYKIEVQNESYFYDEFLRGVCFKISANTGV